MTDAASNFTTARRWELVVGPGFIADVHQSGNALRMLSDVCTATAATLEFAVKSRFATPGEILSQYPLVLEQCDRLTFDEMPQALSYLALHLPDRYCRVFQVLEKLLLQGMLPLGRMGSFAAVDIGAGPGPGIFAVRNFYAALRHFAGLHLGRPVSPLRVSAVVERSAGMGRVMHYFAESLVLIEQGRWTGESVNTQPSSPYAEVLAQSATPFGPSHDDFSGLDLRGDHIEARRRLAYELEDELGIDPRSASRLANEEPIGVPSAYALALMTNFLTTADAVPTFTRALERLMQTSLVPGGLLVVLGGVGQHYPETYSQLDDLARRAGLHIMEGFEEALQAGSRVDELKMLATLTRSVWRRLAADATDTSEVQHELRQMGAHDIFDESVPFSLPRFQVRVYRRGAWPRISATGSG